MSVPSRGTARDRVGEVVARVQLPLENLEYALDAYLYDNANWLDPRTRDMLVSVREGVGQVAMSARALSDADARPQGPSGERPADVASPADEGARYLAPAR